MTGTAGSRFVLPDLAHALAWSRDRNDRGISCTLHVLDEFTRTAEQVNAVTAIYRETIAGMAERGIRGSVSVKLSSFGSLFDMNLAIDRTGDLGREAREKGIGFEIDAEGREMAGAALEAAMLLAQRKVPVVLALQAYLYRTPGDLRLLLAHGITPRFVKGAYIGDVSDYHEIGNRLIDLVREAARFEVGFSVGTHDPVILPAIRSLMADHRERITFGFLMGLSDATKLSMAGEGWKVAEYVPFGEEPGPYITRRERYLHDLENTGRMPAP